ncbi:hypothetical protein FrondiHNR_01800 [Lysinibacter sp. HNR]|nr:hypothetical protein [Lysinibacter sp. HNR]WGD38574.1 hypothetical protein FrondiHNR_01800 [Lysinibacter sp. HNR]
MAYAGEEGPPEYIRQAFNLLGTERIDHEIHAVECPELLAQLSAEGSLSPCIHSRAYVCVRLPSYLHTRFFDWMMPACRSPSIQTAPHLLWRLY